MGQVMTGPRDDPATITRESRPTVSVASVAASRRLSQAVRVEHAGKESTA